MPSVEAEKFRPDWDSHHCCAHVVCPDLYSDPYPCHNRGHVDSDLVDSDLVDSDLVDSGLVESGLVLHSSPVPARLSPQWLRNQIVKRNPGWLLRFCFFAVSFKSFPPVPLLKTAIAVPLGPRLYLS